MGKGVVSLYQDNISFRNLIQEIIFDQNSSYLLTLCAIMHDKVFFTLIAANFAFLTSYLTYMLHFFFTLSTTESLNNIKLHTVFTACNTMNNFQCPLTVTGLRQGLGMFYILYISS